VNTKEEGHPIEVPHGLIHDWIGLLFIPNSSLAQTLAVVQDYDNHQNIYKPEVRHSKLLQRNGDNFKVFVQLYKRSLVTVVINADFDINFERFGTNRVVSHSYSTRLAEVEDAGQAGEREVPVGNAHGYLWRLHSYWRFEEKDGGVYVQLEGIGLSRAVPAIIGWLVTPLLRSIPRGTISSLLGATRAAVTNLRTKGDSNRAMANSSCYPSRLNVATLAAEIVPFEDSSGPGSEATTVSKKESGLRLDSGQPTRPARAKRYAC